jgi:thiol-disulfide isomerase/thioredoxin
LAPPPTKKPRVPALIFKSPPLPHFYAAVRTFFELAKKPIDITYTALDDKIVDLKKLRGKVVLVDFWATWCGPCVAELPNIKKVYDKYHDKGLEVVGISLEMANLNPEDTPDQTTAKLNKSKTALLQFLAKRNMTWPQYFDGKGWENPFSKRYALSGIPALFLLDQEGKIVTTRARGDVLEKEVKRLLKL